MRANDISSIGHWRQLADQGLEPLVFQNAFDRSDAVGPFGVTMRRFMMDEAGMRDK
jgi:hypothetical protein